MTGALFMSGAIIVIYAAFALLALSQEQHWINVTRELGLSEPSPLARARLRWYGVFGLISGLALCMVGNGLVFGSVVWAMCLSLCATLVAFTLAWKSCWIRLFLKLVQS